MTEPRFGDRGKPSESSAPRFGNRGRPAGQKPNYVIPKRVKVGPIELNLTDASDLQRLGSQGFVQGQMPRAVGVIGTVMGIPDAIRQRSFDPIAEAYRQNRQAEIDATDQARARAGLLGTAVEIGGSLVSGGGIANQGRKALANAPRVANEARKVLQAVAPRSGSTAGKVARSTARSAMAAGTGAAAGAAYGSGEGRATENAIYGAAGGALGEPVARVAGAAVRGVRRAIRKPAVKPEVKAARTILDPLSNKINLEKAQAQIDEANRLGLPPLSLVDVMTNSGKRFVRGVAGNTTDDAQEMAVDYALTTRQNMPENALNIVRKITGKDVDLAALRQQGDEALQAVDRANYGALEPVRVMVDAPLLDNLVTRQGNSAVKQSGRVSNTDRRFDDEAALGRVSDVLKTGQVGRATGENDVSVSLQALEDVYRIMRDRAAKMMADENPSATKREGYALMQEAERLGQSLAVRFPEISAARLASQQARKNIEAIDLGYNAFTRNRVPSELAADIGQLPARQNVLAGAQARLQHEIGQNPLNALGSLGYTTNQSARLAAMGAPADDIVAAARIEAKRARNAEFISPNTGSQSQLRATDLPEGIAAIPSTTMGWTNKLMNFAYRRASAFTPAELEALVKMGIGPADLQQLQALAARDPDKVPAAVQALIGTQLGIQSANQSNAAGRYPAGQ